MKTVTIELTEKEIKAIYVSAQERWINLNRMIQSNPQLKDFNREECINQAIDIEEMGYKLKNIITKAGF